VGIDVISNKKKESQLIAEGWELIEEMVNDYNPTAEQRVKIEIALGIFNPTIFRSLKNQSED
jgi:hypothetical protein